MRSRARLRRADRLAHRRPTAGTPALRRWRACAHPHRQPATPAGIPGGHAGIPPEAPDLRAADPTLEHPPDSGPRQRRYASHVMAYGHR